MGEEKKEGIQEIEQKCQEDDELISEIHIKVYQSGMFDIHIPEDKPNVTPLQIEELAKMVYEQLHDRRIAEQAVNLFAARLIGR